MSIKKRNPIFFFLFLLVIVVLAGYFGFKMYESSLHAPVDSNGKVAAFVINPGETPKEVADRLEKAGLIRSTWVFMQVYKSGEKPTIQAGDFKLSPAMTVEEIVKGLQSGSVDMRVTLLEGWRSEQIAQALEKNLGIPQADFLKLAREGYMFPDTYLFNPDATADTVVRTLEATFGKRFDDDLRKKVHTKGLTDEQAVILASLVEREGRSDKVRQEVAGIMLKRLKMGMKLDIDATVRYAIDTQSYKSNPKLDKWWGSINQEDYSSVKSAFNTYLNSGLPPSPICNPSLSSLQAVANADSSTPYLYYYHDSAGNSYYAKTLEEHSRNAREHP